MYAKVILVLKTDSTNHPIKSRRASRKLIRCKVDSEQLEREFIHSEFEAFTRTQRGNSLQFSLEVREFYLYIAWKPAYKSVL